MFINPSIMAQIMPEVILYHATFTDVAEKIKKGEDLYGWVDPKNTQGSGNLTDHPGTADLFSIFYDSQTIYDHNASPVILKFRLRSDQVRCLGKISGYGGDAYATTMEVPIDYVPETYIMRTRFFRDDAKKRGIIFYRVPSSALFDMTE